MVPPVTHACEAVEAKTKELRRLSQAEEPSSVQRLSLSLQGALDAAVNGGVARYREAFLDPGADVPAEMAGEVARLRRLLVEQVGVITYNFFHFV